MRLSFFVVLFVASLVSYNGWENDIDKAKKKAHTEHKLILLEFSGSDWCGPCIRLRKEIFETDDFKDFADRTLVLLNADFPRLKKNQLSKDQQKKNDKLADIYNPEGIFPVTLLLDADGKVLRTWQGYFNLPVTEFISQIKAAGNATN